MTSREEITLTENLDEAIKELQRVRSQLSKLAEVAGSPAQSPDEVKAPVQSLSLHIRQALTHIRSAKGQAKGDS
jgi:dynactin complex subunit